MLKFLKKDKNKYKLILHHNNGVTETELDNVTNIDNITKYLGKDKVVEHQNISVNLKNYHVVEKELKP